MTYPRLRLALVGLLFLVPSPAVGAHNSDGSISISRRHGFAVCAGICPEYDVTVWDDGRVLAVRRNFDAADEVDFFQVSPAAASEFRRILLPFRPGEEQPYQIECNSDAKPEMRPVVLKVTEIAIRWSGDSEPSHLAACVKSNRKLLEAIDQALSAVRLNITANRRPQR